MKSRYLFILPSIEPENGINWFGTIWDKSQQKWFLQITIAEQYKNSISPLNKSPKILNLDPYWRFIISKGGLGGLPLRFYWNLAVNCFAEIWRPIFLRLNSKLRKYFKIQNQCWANFGNFSKISFNLSRRSFLQKCKQRFCHFYPFLRVFFA